jgi:type II secretory pathway pseudopilin PulG
MKGSQLKRMTIVIAVCAAVGAIAGIAGSAAAPSSSSSKAKATTKAQKQAAKRQARALKRGFRGFAGPGGPGGHGIGGGPVHATAVVPNQDGTGFDTITTDAGTLNSVDGTTVHVKEAIDKATYKDDVAVDVGDNAKVIRNGQDAKLSDLKAGDHVRVITGGAKGNIVIAEDDAWIAQMKKRFSERGAFRHHGFGPGGPPPGAPGPGGYPGDNGGSNQNGSDSGSSSSGSNS